MNTYYSVWCVKLIETIFPTSAKWFSILSPDISQAVFALEITPIKYPLLCILKDVAHLL